MTKHKQNKHAGIRYPCDQCEYIATLQSNLKIHKQSNHEGIRYPCDQCDYAATQLFALKKHKQSKHEGIRYPCDQCKYALTDLGDLRNHKMQKHLKISADTTVIPILSQVNTLRMFFLMIFRKLILFLESLNLG